MKYIVAILLFLFSMTASAQIMQVNTAPGGYQFRALKADTMLIAPRGDTSAIGWTKWGVGTNGALHFRTADTTLYVRFNNKWYPVGSGGTGGGGGGTITNISFRAGTVVDTLYFTDSGGDVDWYWVVVKDGLISGGQVTYTGFARTYAVSAALFRKNGQFYTTNDTTITIAALSDPDSSRSDVFIVNTSGQATTLTGVESANPLTPQIDPDTEVYLTHVTLSPSAPSAGIDTTVIYDENTEWVGGASGVTVNFAGTTTPYRGTYVTDVSAINSGDIIGYGTGTAVNRTSYAGISLFLKLKATMPNNNNIFVAFFNGNTQVSSEVALPITKSNTLSYQGLSLGFDAFTFSNNLFDSVRFRYNGSGITGLYLDFIYLQNGMAPVVINPGTDFVQNIRRVGDNIEQQKNGVWTPVIDISDKKSGTVTSVATNTATGITGGTITTSGTLAIDTFLISTRAWRDKLADSLGAIIATKGTGTVTNFSAGDLSPLFTTSEATTTTTPALSFSLSNAGSYTVFGNQTNASAAPSFAKLNINTIDATGTPSATTYLRGDGSWSTVSASGAPIDSVTIRWNSTASSIYTFNGGFGGTSASRQNVGVGQSTFNSLTTGAQNVAIGYGAAYTYNGSASQFIGYEAGYNKASGNGATAFGFRALYNDNGTGDDNTAFGNNAMYSNGTTKPSLAVAIGARAMYNGGGTQNIAIGADALDALTTGQRNVSIGANSMGAATTTNNAVAIGYNAGLGMVAGVINATYIGSGAGDVTTGSYNTGVGTDVFGNVTSGSDNTAMGQGAMLAGASSSATNNAAFGSATLYNITNGTRNSAVGYYAGSGITSGGNNSILGAQAALGGQITTGSYNVMIGSNAQIMSGTASDQFVLGGNNIRWMMSDVSGSGRRWLINATTSNVTSFTTSAALEINGTLGAVLFPRLTTTQRDALTATDGMVIYNTSTSKLQVRAGGAWVDLH